MRLLLIFSLITIATTRIFSQTDCNVSNNVSVSVVLQPTINASGAITICTGGDATLSATLAGGTGGCVIQWQSSNDGVLWTDIVGANDSTYKALALSNTTHYRAMVTCAGYGCDVSYSNSQTVTVIPPPVVVAQPNDITECVGGDMPLTIAITGGTGNITYQWQSSDDGLAWTNEVGANGASYIPPSGVVGSKYYRVITSVDGSGCGSITSNPATVTIVDDPTVSIAASSESLCTGNVATLSSTVQGGVGAISYQWQSSPDAATWTNITNAITASYLVTPSVTTYYRVVVTQGSGCLTVSSPVKINVNPCAGVIGDVAWIDCDRDGIFDGGEKILGGVGVTLSGVDTVGNPVNLSTTTDGNGRYRFESLMAGTYTITFGLPATPAGLTLGGIKRTTFAAGASTTVILTSGEINLDVDVAFYDTQAPVLAGVPADLLVSCESVPSPANVLASDNVDNNVSVIFNELRTAGSCGGNYVLTRTWSATDACGNTATASQVITVEDKTAPTLAGLPSDVTVSCDNVPTAPSVTATDNCDSNPNVTMAETRTAGSCGGNYTLTRTWTATDACGNTATGSQVITVEDKTSPILAGIPADLTVSCDNVPAIATGITASDNCDATPTVTVAETRTNGSCGGNYTLTRTWTATDACGNTSTGSQVITVEDKTSPTLAGIPANLTVSCDNIPAVATGITASDNCDATPTVTVAETRTNGSCGGNYTLTRTWTATDACGNTATGSQVITVEDKTSPTLAGIPADLTVSCDNVPTPANVTASDNCDGNPNVTVAETRAAGSCGGNYTLTRVWTATDACGNTATGSQVITVEDKTAPMLVGVPANVTVDCDQVPAPANVTATDNCDGNPTIDMDEVRGGGKGDEEVNRVSGTCGTYTLTRTWTVTDACGNTATASQVITVEDKTAPVLAGIPANLTVSCDNIPAVATGITATDNCDINPRIAFAENRTTGSCGGNYTIRRMWTATDACGNSSVATQVITVEDKTVPVLAGIPSNVTVSCDNIPTAPSVSATDNCDNNPRVTMAETRAAGSCGGNYALTRTWTATDACGNTATASQVITVEDKTAPILVGIPADVTVNCDNVPTPANVTATDNCDGNPTIVMDEVRGGGKGDNEVNRLSGTCGTYTLTRTWTVTDACGNTATASQVITVEDKVAPVLAGIPANVTVSCDNVPAVATGITAADNCDINPRITFAENRTNGSCGGNYTIRRMWTATDACGNSSVATQVITVEDKTTPILAGVPANVTVSCSNVPTAPSVTATDNCDSNPNVTMAETRAAGSCAGNYVLTRTWTATDACGNRATASQVITVEDKTAPILAGVPANVTVTCSSVPTAPSVTATDNCDNNPRVTMAETRAAGACGGNYVLTRTWTATDACGNTATGSQVITVEDKTAPILAAVPANQTVSCGNVPTAPALTATDNCDNNPRVTMAETRAAGSCGGNFTLTRTWTATDACGNTATASQVITVEDKTAPILAGIPANVTVSCDNVPAVGTGITATDNCDANPRIAFAENRVSGNCAGNYIIRRTWTATDACGNTAAATQLITVEDKTAPVLAGIPSNATVSCERVPTAPSVSATDNCDNSPRVAMVENRRNGNCGGNYVLTRTWTATDACGNTATASQVITVEDKTAPVFAGVPQDANIRCSETIPTAVNPTATDNCNANVTVRMTQSRQNGNCAGNYRIVRVWTATDACGNTATASQTINVSDTEGPTFRFVPANATVSCTAAIPSGTPLVVDNCEGTASTVRLSVNETRTAGSCGGNYRLTRVWTATDGCGNTSTASQVITVVDNVAPVFANVPAAVSSECGSTVPPVVNPTATDNCDASPRISFNETRINGACSNSYRLIRTWTATDACGNTSTVTQQVSVGDTKPPVLVSVPSNATVKCDGSIPDGSGVTATDNCDAAPRVSMNDVITRGNCTSSYTITRTWTATDACGNTATASQVISVGDNQSPEFANVPQDVVLGCTEAIPAVTNPSVTDNCDVRPRISFVETRVNGACSNSYKLVRVWTATDACGNVATAKQEISVGDNTPPLISNVPADITANCGGSSLPAVVNPTVTDACDASPRLTLNETRENGLCANSYKIVRVWTATDACGNTATASQTVSVGDVTAPTLVSVPANATVRCNESVPTGAVVTATDNCDAAPRVSMNDVITRGTCAGNYTITRTWTATDACGNTATASQVIVVGDSESPLLTGVPADITANCGGAALPAVVNPTVADGCDPSPRLTLNETRENGLCANSYKIVRVWTATDACGNTATASQTVSVGDVTAPTLVSVPANATVKCNESVPTGAVVTATDNCDAAPRVSMNDVITRGTCAGNYTITRTWTATDACGNTATASQVIVVGDSESPLLTGVPADITANCGGAALPAVVNPTVADGCDPSPRLTLNETRENGLCANSYKIVRVWTATDACGNTATASQTVSVGDVTAPTLVSVPANATVKCNESVPTGAVVTATDNCDAAPRVSMNDVITRGTCAGNYTITRTWTATDACGNTATASQVIVVGDSESPLLTGVPADITANCGGAALPAVVNPTVADGCDPSPRLTLNETRENGLCANSYKIVRVWTATDACGNTATASQTVSVGDVTAPTLLNVPANVNVSCTGEIPAGIEVRSVDNCDEAPRVSMRDNITRGNCAGSYTITRMWTATDACGNTATATQIITVGDNDAPVLSGIPANLNLNCTDAIPTAVTPSVSDACDANPRVRFIESRENGTCGSSYRIIRQWIATDACGNVSTSTQTISVNDNVAPELVGVPSNVTVSCSGVPNPASVTARDNCDLNPRVTLTDRIVRGSCVDNYVIHRTWTATDACGNTSQRTQLITVEDKVKPELIAVPTNITINLARNSVPNAPTLTATDNCDSRVDVSFAETRRNGSGCSYALVRTWTAVDNCGNRDVRTQTITVVDSLNDARLVTTTPENCSKSDARAEFSPNSYTYRWNDGATGALRTNLKAGAYTVTVSNANGCTRIMTVNISRTCDNQCVTPIVVVNKTDVSCGSTSDGKVNLTLSNGNVADFNFVWTPSVSVSNTASNLAPGEYRVRVVRKDLSTCFAEITFRIEAPQTLAVEDPIVKNASCTAANGSIEFLNAIGTSFRYRWSDGDTNRVRTNLAQGDYKLTITSPNTYSCPVERTVTVGSENNLKTTFVINRQPACGRPDGAVTLNTTGGSGSYSYSWGEGSSRFVLSAGTMTVTVTDNATGCKTTVTFTLVNRAVEAQVNMDTVISTTCNGSFDARLNYTLNANAAFIFPANVQIRDAQNRIYSNGALGVGSYTLFVRDSSGCLAAQRNFRVTQPDAVTVNFTRTNQTCDVNGTINLTVTGGTGAYRYSWSDLTGQPNQPKDRVNLQSGFYSVTVTDALGCQRVVRNIQITDGCSCRPPVVDSVRVVNATCGTSNGVATVILRGGNESNYNYTWSPVRGTANAVGNMRFGLPSGTYTVTIASKTNADCFVKVTIAVGTTQGPTGITATTTAATCEMANGTATLRPAPGDSLTYTWLFDNKTGATRGDLKAGTYQVLVRRNSATQCPTVVNVTIPMVNNLTASTTINRSATCGSSNGSATIRVSGGSGNYTYSWGSSNSRTDLKEGVYTVTITDGTSKCQIVETFTVPGSVTTPANIAMTDTVVFVSCNGLTNATVNFNVTYPTGFALPAQVQIVDAAGRTYTNGNLGVGEYCVVVRNANGCVTASRCFEVRQPARLAVNPVVANTTCTTRGSITLNVTGGTGAYTFNWNDLTGSGQTNIRTNLNPGTYGYTVTDARGCTLVVDTTTVRNGCATQNVCTLKASATATNRTCTEGGKISVTIAGGTAPFTFDWLDLTGTNNPQNRTELAAGQYTLVVIDAAGCRDTVRNLTVRNACSSVACVPATISGINVLDARCGQSNGSATINVISSNNLTYRWTPNVSTSASATGLAAGVYRVRIMNTNDTTCYVERDVVIRNQNGGGVGEPTVIPATCASNSGRIEFNNLTRLFNFNWSDGRLGSVRTNLASGRYFVTVTDPTGEFCAQIMAIDVPSVNSLTATASIDRRATCGQANGQATIRPTGGSGSYAYSWGTSATRSNLSAGTTSVTVTDNQTGCTTVVNVVMTDEISAGATISIAQSVIFVSCAGNRDASVSYDVSYAVGFAAPARIELRDAAGRLAKNDSLGAGRYTIQVFDRNGCLATTAAFEVRESAQAIVAQATPMAKTCTAQGSISVNLTGGSGIYRFNWSDLTGTNQPQNRTGINAGTYSLTITDTRGCQAILNNIVIANDSVNCNVNVPKLISAVSTNKTCTTNGSITLTTIGGTAPYTFDWADISGTNNAQNRTGLNEGLYAVTVTDARGVRDSITNIRILNTCTAPVCNVKATLAAVNTTCTEGGKINVTVSGGTTPYSFDWLDLTGTNNAQNRTGLTADTYTLVVIDAAGCRDTQRVAVSNGCVNRPKRDTVTYNVVIRGSVSTCLPVDGVLSGLLTSSSLCGGGSSANLNLGTVTLTTQGCFIYRANSATGTDQFCVRTCTLSGLCDTTIVVVNVTPISDMCTGVYRGTTLLNAPHCDSTAVLCTNIGRAQASYFTITDNGAAITSTTYCGQSEMINYNYSSLTSSSSGLWILNGWTVNGRKYTGIFSSITALVDSMNRWDSNKNWYNDVARQTIVGGASNSQYGGMSWFNLFGRAIATTLPVKSNIPAQLSLRLKVGNHRLVFNNSATGCRDTLMVSVGCPLAPVVTNRLLDTVMYIGDNTRWCFPNTLVASQTTITNVCPQNNRAYVSTAIDEVSDCISLAANGVGRDTFCFRRCATNGTCDTVRMIVTVKLFPTPSDTACIKPYAGSTTVSTPCNTPAKICTQLSGSDTLTYDITLNGAPYRNGYYPCESDTITSYTYYSLILGNPNGPWRLDSWSVNEKVYSGTIPSIKALVDSMNTWDPNGRWRLEANSYAIKGGVNANRYGNMNWSRNNVRIASFTPSRQVVVRKMGMYLNTGVNTIVFHNRVRNCRDTVRITVNCYNPIVRQRHFARATNIVVGSSASVCLDQVGTRPEMTTITNVRSRNNRTTVRINDSTDCLTIKGNQIGSDTLIVKRYYNGDPSDADSTIVYVNVLRGIFASSRTITRTIEVGKDSTECFDNNQVAVSKFFNACEPNANDNVNFIISGKCLTYMADNVGVDTACLIRCDNLGNCDTIRFVVRVVEEGAKLSAPVAKDDKVVTPREGTSKLFPMANDVTHDLPTTMELLEQPKFGKAMLNPADGAVTYTPKQGDCEARDSFRYAIVNGGGRDTAWVMVEVICDEILVFSGFSPNNDGVNDLFVILGLEKYPDNSLMVFNRYGNQVFNADGYKNNWDGSFEGKGLPDGTYFWILNLGNGKKKSGYVQIHR